MTITESLEILRAARPLTETFDLQLACSFTPLHLKTLLAGHLQNRIVGRRVIVHEGTFGDLAGTIERTDQAFLAVAMEWSDLDPRLKYREGGAWGKALDSDLLQTAKMMLGRVERALASLPSHTAVSISLPTLPLLPAFYPPKWQCGPVEAVLYRELMDFASRISERPNVRLVNPAWLGEHSSPANRFDVKSELLIGFPYTLPHADALASVLALQLAPPQPLKGIITDLDNTFWSGLVGEIGPHAVRWDPASRYYLHGLYQKLLSALSDEGILVGIASKNDPEVVRQAFERQDLLIPPDKIFPIEVHWSPKSESVTRILKKWNILADSVAFVDDTALELAEVANAHPGIHCIQFPAGDYSGVWSLLEQLRNLFGKSQLSREDGLRMESLRRGVSFQEQALDSSGSEDFLSTVNATLTFNFDAAPGNSRDLELVNKTNQFNINGRRLTQAEWHKRLVNPGAFLVSVNYQDKFGALGTIAVVQGRAEKESLTVETWVMSCRAFSRRIEHATLKKLFEIFRARSIYCDFEATAKNGPLREFFAEILGRTPESSFEFTADQFEKVCPPLYHKVEEMTGVTLNG